MFQAWNTARMSHFHGGKLNPLGEELKALRPPEPPRRQTNEEIIAAMKAIRATMGG